MTVKTQIESLTKPTSIALGVFDGVHIGHQAVIGEAVNGEADGLMPVVFTFDTGGEKPEHKKRSGDHFNHQSEKEEDGRTGGIGHLRNTV